MYFTSKRLCLLVLALLLMLPAVDGQTPMSREAMLERARALELKTVYEPPPGEALEHHASGYAKVICSAVFITGLDPDFAAENVGYFTAPYAERKKLGRPVIDRVAKRVSVRLPNGVERVALYTGDQGCVTLPKGVTKLGFTPVKVARSLPNATNAAEALKMAWPIGDRLPEAGPKGVDMAKVRQALDAAFEPASGQTAAFVVTWKGQLIGERYATGINYLTPLESWSMGKSLSATIMGILIRQGVYDLWQPAPIPEWQQPGDPRAKWPPNTVGRYRNTDPVLINYLNRLGIEKQKEVYHTFPQRRLFDKLGIRTMVMETDPYGNFLTQGYEFASGRDWARLGNLYLQDGVWNGERILPEGYVRFASTLAPAWEADGRPIYGGFFWLNGNDEFPVPREAYFMAGAGGQYTMIIPSHDLVVVRLGHYKGATDGEKSLKRALALLLGAVPKRP